MFARHLNRLEHEFGVICLFGNYTVKPRCAVGGLINAVYIIAVDCHPAGYARLVSMNFNVRIVDSGRNNGLYFLQLESGLLQSLNYSHHPFDAAALIDATNYL
jgi:hypothetical protein